ncbi:ABC transporter permease subunit [Actinoplanes sp. NPDC024001]|uniref:ABC transporter permease subunit n=1 Tax=Actinoplanes sp. NPDC024001 TaxID=3154598 RepID=UPI0033CF0DE7
MTAHESFPRLLLAEWIKLRSVSRWLVTLVSAVLLTIGLGYLAASGSRTDVNRFPDFVTGPRGEPVADEFFFVHQPVTGDATLTVRVASLTTEEDRSTVRMASEELSRLDDPSPFAGAAAGLMIKDGTRPGSSYASVSSTAGRGARLQWDFDGDRPGSAGGAARWLRLQRSGATITGYESADGVTWRKIGTATPKALPATAEIGFYVSSPPARYTTRGGGSSSVGTRPTETEAVFDNVSLDAGGAWQGDAIRMATGSGEKEAPLVDGRVVVTGSTYTVTGSGKIGPHPPDDDMVSAALIGTLAGLMALIAVGVLFATSEYRHGMIRTTLAASPRRGRVLAAKAVVLGAVSFLVGLVGTVGSFLVAVPVLRDQGFTLPAFPRPSLADGAVLRALVLTAVFMAGVAVVGLAIGMLLRHSAAAITITVVLVLLPLIAGMILPGTSPKWLLYTTLAGGLATQRAKPPAVTLAEPWAMIGPWAGIAVVAAWVVGALGLAWWQLRKRDS